MGIGLDLPSFIGQLVSFLLLMAILTHFGYRPIRRILDERSQRIRESVEQAELARIDYERVRAEAEQELKDARAETHRLLIEAGVARDRIMEEARAQARDEARVIAEESRAHVEEERKAIVEQLRREFADAAVSVAETIVQENLDADRHRGLIEKALEERLPLEDGH
ncbi:MAG: F0F1 ATP synthase subunit B [Dehalococcoidia bacterium]|nr:F0F1 ATP synthase subunit B [Dehalococcoidia bacterium]